MTRICHLFDGSAGWEHRVGAGQLLDRLPGDRFDQRVVTNSRATADTLRLPCDRYRISSLPAMGRLWATISFAHAARKHKPDLVHAWGVSAAATAAAATRLPIIVSLSDPAFSPGEIRLLRTISRPQHFVFACSCERVRRRLIEGGVGPDVCVVLRPGVDFDFINRCKRSSLREDLGIEPRHRLVILPEPATRAGGHRYAAYAVGMIGQRTDDVRLIVPGLSRVKDRAERITRNLPNDRIVVTPDPRIEFERLLSVSDVLVCAPRGDISTTAIAWAMAARVSVVGSAVHAIAELIAHKLNGRLFKVEPDKGLLTPIVKALRNREDEAKIRETACGQAYEVFSVRRHLDQYARLCENVIAGHLPGEGISDPAMSA